MGTRWEMWAELANEFATEARDRGVPTTTKLDGSLWDRDRKAWKFPITYTWAQGAGDLQDSVTITRRGRLVEVRSFVPAPPFTANSASGRSEAKPYEKTSVKRAFDAYLKRSAP